MSKKQHLEILKRFCERRLKLNKKKAQELGTLYEPSRRLRDREGKFSGSSYTREDLQDFEELRKLNKKALGKGKERLKQAWAQIGGRSG